MHTEPQDQHRWLQKLVGEWTFESEFLMGPDQPPMTSQGVEVVRPLGDLWTVAEGEGDVPGGGTMKSIMTLGFEPTNGRFVGTFISSGMAFLWTYSGSLDADGRVLALDADGPSFTGEGLAKYIDSVELVDDDHRILTSRVLGEDGNWVQFMTAHYYRKK